MRMYEWREANTVILKRDDIRCPNCGILQGADVTHTEGDPWAIWIHECVACGYMIMESEWDAVEVAA